MNQTHTSEDPKKKAEYSREYAAFVNTLTPEQRRSLAGETSADWQSKSTFALPVRPDDPAYMTDGKDEIIETLEELRTIDGALPKIALWLNDQIGTLAVLESQQQLHIALARICDAKNPRLEAHLVALSVGMSLLGNANGHKIAEHFQIKAQTFHERLSETSAALGVGKPLSKINTERYKSTQYSHNFKKDDVT